MRKAAPRLQLPEGLGATIVLLVLAILFWKFRILDHGTNPTIEVGPIDIYSELLPMNAYGFGVLSTRHIPLWNPYQFCGEPFLAMAYVGMLYPPHLINIVFDVLASLELSFVLHMFLAGMGMWCLARHFGISTLGALAAALTFTWSGWLVHSNYLPPTYEAMTWMPLVVWLIDRVMAGTRHAWCWLILALANQVLVGAVEPFVHTLYLGGLFVGCRFLQLTVSGAWRLAIGRSVLLGGCVTAAMLLASPQLLPAVELTLESARAPGSLTLAQVMYPGVIPPGQFVPAALEGIGIVTVGALPLLAIPLVVGFRQCRLVWIVALIAAVVAALLVFGEPVYRYYYYAVPVLGRMFRRPMKFLDIYAFGQALLAGAALTRLDAWANVRRGQLLRQPNWLGALAAALVALWWLVAHGKRYWHFAGALGLLLLCWALPKPAQRRAVLVGLCVLQGANLFFTVGNPHVRPVKRPEIFHTHKALFDSVKLKLGNARVYLSGRFLFWPDLTAKQGLLTKMPVVSDYEPLATGRYGTFFETISPRTDTSTPFYGIYDLRPTSRWRLMDLTGTRYFVMLRGEPGDVFMAHNAQFQQVYEDPNVHVFEKRSVQPRAYVVPRARVLDSPEQVLAELDSPRFSPRTEVLLEEPVPVPALGTQEPEASNHVEITSYEPERIVIAAHLTTPGFLVLGDLFYPGWNAFVDNHEVPILRANYLFRAVRLDPGNAEVRFEYHPASFRLGLILSASTAICIAIAVVWSMRFRRQRPDWSRGTQAARVI